MSISQLNSNWITLKMAKYKNFSCTDKRRLIEPHSRGEDYKALADCLGINRNTAKTIVRHGRYENLPKCGSYNRKIDKEVILGAIDTLEGNPLMTLQQVNFARLPQKLHFTQQALSKALEERMITFKIAINGSAERNSEENIEDLYNYTMWTMSLDVISSRKNFVDEFGVNIHMRRTKGRSAKDERAYRKVSAQKGPNVTICCAVSTEVLLHYQVIQVEWRKKI